MALRRVLIYLGAVFLMSHIVANNVSALDAVINLNDYDVIPVSVSPNYYDYQMSNTSHNCLKTYNCKLYGGETLRIASTHDTFALKKDDIITYNIIFWQNTPLGSVSTSQLVPRPLTPGANVSSFYEHEVTDNSIVYYNLWLDGSNTYEIDTAEVIVASYEIALKVNANTTAPLGSFNYNTVDFEFKAHSANYLNVAVTGFTLYRKRTQGSQDQENEVNATNDSVQQSETAGSSSEQSAEQGTASLISTIGSAVSVISSASPTNCKLNGNMGNFDMGEIDLCANPVPSFVQIISSLILILITVPLCIVLFNRFIGLFRSFQG